MANTLANLIKEAELAIAAENASRNAIRTTPVNNTLRNLAVGSGALGAGTAGGYYGVGAFTDRPMEHRPSGIKPNALQSLLTDYVRGVGDRVSNPTNTLRSAIDRMKSQPVEEMALDWSNPVAGGLVGMFAGKGAKTANLAMLAKAEELAKSGVADDQIWKQTGWTLKTPDGMPRFEIHDNKAAWFDRHGSDIAEAIDKSNMNEFGANVGNMVEHQPLTTAYPELNKTSIMHSANGEIGASYNPASNNITLNTMNGYAAKDKLMSRNLHELQHAIQQREGFARGGSPDTMPFNERDYARWLKQDSINNAAFSRAQTNNGIDPETGLDLDTINSNLKALGKQIREYSSPHEAYRRLAGEAESRLTQARMNLTPEERLAQYPYDPEYFQGATGVPLNSLIMRMK